MRVIFSAKHFVYVQVPGVDIVMDYSYWMVQHPADQYTHQKVRDVHAAGVFFFCPILVYFLRMSLSSSLPLVTHIRGHMVRTPLHSPPPRTCLRFSRGKRKRFRIRFPSLASPCVELGCIHATYQYNTQHAGCMALSAVSSYTGAFVSGLISTRTDTYVISSYKLLAVYI